ncbi:adenylate kinase isoenzyme 5 isoform X2 [Planococcus citri]
MTDLLQQYTIGSGETKDFNQLSSKTVAEVLMLEMKMSPAAKTFLISGYPRNMRDVVEYTDKIKAVSGIIVLSWTRSSLEKQIEYGAKLGHVVLSLARMELNNFYKNVIPVADFYDQRKMLTSINGERNPAEVYNDFRAVILRIIGSQDAEKTATLTTIPNGTVVNLQPDPVLSTSSITNTVPAVSVTVPASVTGGSLTTTTAVSVHNPPPSGYPAAVYVIGGPGSNKGLLIGKVLRRLPGWSHISMGGVLRAMVNSRDIPIEEAQRVRDTISAGEMVDKNVVNAVLDRAMLANINANGIIIDGFPRDLDELHDFEEKYQQHPWIILLDCSKLQLSRGRWDDSVPAFRKRLEIFRERTLPMLKVLDTEHRLTMVDGDTETPEVEEAFNIALFEAIQHVQEDFALEHGPDARQQIPMNFEAALLQDLEDEILENISGRPQVNGYGPPRERRSTSIIAGGKPGPNNVMSVSHANGGNHSQGNTLQTHAQVESYPK